MDRGPVRKSHSPSRSWWAPRRRRDRRCAPAGERALELAGGAGRFTGSANEAIKLAHSRNDENAPPQRKRIHHCRDEHRGCARQCEWSRRGHRSHCLRLGPDGLLDLSLLDRELDERVALVAAMRSIMR